ncbi:MAG: hypothetical protein D4R57_00540 [Verrucomicrobiales bacterium]|nr:MAG: hypothetical protein D4R57_00540 [Verrucomicrobiales bacterium]
MARRGGIYAGNKGGQVSIYDRQLAVSGGTIHHIGLLMQAGQRPPQHRCAWCDAESGRKPDPDMNESHGICHRHKATIEANLEQLRKTT